MVKEYYEAANQIMEIAESCEDAEIANILKAGSSKIFELAMKHGGIIKTASKESDNIATTENS